jgi:four helix bundle protein
MARRSADEVHSELYLALDADFISQEELKQAYDLAVETKKPINGMISYLSKN